MESDYRDHLKTKSNKELVFIIYIEPNKYEQMLLNQAKQLLIDREVDEKEIRLLRIKIRKDIRRTNYAVESQNNNKGCFGALFEFLNTL